MKKFLTIILSVLLVVSMVPAIVFAVDEYDELLIAPITTSELDIVIAPNPGADVVVGKYYHVPMAWAYSTGILEEGQDIVPEENCSRADMVYYLWKKADSPSFEGAECQFTDVKTTDYFYDAVVWGWNIGIINGKTETLFAPNDTVKRGEAVTFIYRYAKVAGGDLPNPFTDVVEGAFYYYPVVWAYNNGITNGTSETTFSPNKLLTNGQIITLIYRYNLFETAE